MSTKINGSNPNLFNQLSQAYQSQLDQINDELDDTSNKLLQLLNQEAQVKDGMEDVLQQDGSISTEEGSGIAGMYRLQRLLLGHLPEVREGYTMMHEMNMVLSGNPVGAMMLAFTVISLAVSAAKDLQNKINEYNQLVMEYRHLTSISQAQAFQNNQLQNYRSSIIP